MTPDFSTVAARTYNGFAVSREDAPPVAVAAASNGLAPSERPQLRIAKRRNMAAGVAAAALLGAGAGYGLAFVSPFPGMAQGRAASDQEAGRELVEQHLPGLGADVVAAPDALEAPPIPSPAEPQGAEIASRDLAPASSGQPKAIRSPARARATPAHAHRARAKPTRKVASAPRASDPDCDPDLPATDRASCDHKKLPLASRLDLAFSKAFPAADAGEPNELAPPY